MSSSVTVTYRYLDLIVKSHVQSVLFIMENSLNFCQLVANKTKENTHLFICLWLLLDSHKNEYSMQIYSEEF